MTDLILALLLALACGLCVFLAYRYAKAREEAVAEKGRNSGLDLIRENLTRAEAERDAARAEASRLTADLAAVRAAESARAAALREKEEALLAMKAEVEKTFETLATRALGQSEQRFLTLANETFSKHQSAAAGGVKEILAPVQETFAKLSQSVAELDKARTQDKSALSEQLRFVGEALARTQSETGRLITALRAAPKTRGRWGEETLKNVLELSGLSTHCDFSEQTTTADDEGRTLRPDVVIRLPGGRSIIVDAKVALSGYLDALEATDEAAREAHLKKHAAELRAHVSALSSKDYSKHVAESADFVALFIPGENFFAAAVERDPSLFEDAMKKRVVMVTPVTLMALARSIAYGWRQESSAKNAQVIADLGRELHTRLATMAEHAAKLGDAIGKSVGTYNLFVGSLETRVLVSARKFRDLGTADSGVEIEPAAPVEAQPRLLQAQAELALAPPLGKKRAG
jgi:DNA recombination protein RmuC